MTKEYDFKPNTVLAILIFLLSSVSTFFFYFIDETALTVVFAMFALFGIHLIYTRFTKDLKIVINDEQIVIPTSIGKMITIKFEFLTEVVERSQRGFTMLHVYQGKIANTISPSFISVDDYDEIKHILMSKIKD